MFIVFSSTFCLVFSSKCKSVSIDKRYSEEVSNIPRALVERLTNLTVEFDFWRLPMKGWYLLAVRSLFSFILDSKPTASSRTKTEAF